ncbi:MAG TPA: hypothetical protein VNS32_26820 [Flavisolibacter sp.]|nr:hypothetical protein [Flavisolibacter sp.]
MQKLDLAVTNVDGKPITILEGKALEEKAPLKIVMNGDIKTVSTFVEKRKKANSQLEADAGLQTINPDRAIVIVNKEDLSILLLLDPESVYGAEVKAKLEMEPELEKFGIESDRKFTQQQLIKLLKYGKRWFADQSSHETLLQAYMKLDVRVTADLSNDAPDGRGNRANSFAKKVTSNIPEDFILNIPIFKGQDYKKFRVEICLDSTDGSTKFWLESVELAELIQVESEIILKKELESCSDYVAIWK